MTNELIIYKTEDDVVSVDVQFDFDNETVWLSANQMAELFERDETNIRKHINNVFDEGELIRENNTQKMRVDGVKQPVAFYNLDVIISVGYRVKSLRGTQFRQWATRRLNEYIRKGFTMDDERLKDLGGGGYFMELLERIRDIRASEKVYMGLTSFRGSRPHLRDTEIAKNYLNDEELRSMGQIVSGYLDFAERKAEREEAMTMKDWALHLDEILTATGEKLLIGNGTVTHNEAIEKAHDEYKKYQARTLSKVEQDYLDTIKLLEKKK